MKLQDMDFGDLVFIAFEQSKKMDELRGYPSGMTDKKRLAFLGREALIRCIKECAEILGEEV